MVNDDSNQHISRTDDYDTIQQSREDSSRSDGQTDTDNTTDGGATRACPWCSHSCSSKRSPSRFHIILEDRTDGSIATADGNLCQSCWTTFYEHLHDDPQEATEREPVFTAISGGDEQ